MKINRIYVKIFLSFLGVLLITEVLVFGLFANTAGRDIKALMEHFGKAEIKVATAYVNDLLQTAGNDEKKQKEILEELLFFLQETYSSKIWLTDPMDKLIAKSFEGPVPELTGIKKDWHKISLSNSTVYKDTEADKLGLYTMAPLSTYLGDTMVLHLLFVDIRNTNPLFTFHTGLVLIGGIVALLIIPISRFITRPIKELRHSSLMIADGDLSHRAEVNSNDEIGELGQAFNYMADRVESMVKSGKGFTAFISHEVRTPLARIRIALEMIKNNLTPECLKKCDRHVLGIAEDINDLDQLLEQMMMLSKMDMGQVKLHFEKVNAPDLLEALLNKYQTVFAHNNLKVETDFSFEPPFYADTNSLVTVFNNLLDNTIKYTPDEGNVKIVMKSWQNRLIVELANTSSPVKQEDLARLFQPFERAGDLNSAGSGLGLAIVKEIVSKHGGDISASYDEGMFKIEINLPQTC